MNRSPVSVNGWIAGALLTLLAFLLYYDNPLFDNPPFLNNSLYISLAKEWGSNFWFQASYSEKDNTTNDSNQCQIFLNGPKQIADFAENEFTIILQSAEKECKWSLDVKANLAPLKAVPIYIEVQDLEEADIKRTYTQKFKVEYNQKANETKTVRFRIRMLFSQYEAPKQNKKTELTLSFKNNGNDIKWENYTCQTVAHENEKALSEAPSSDDKKASDICIPIDSISAFREGAVKNLLLPPWSNGLIPVVSFMMVWLAEVTLPLSGRMRREQPDPWMFLILLLGACFLVLFWGIFCLYLLKNELRKALLLLVIFVLKIFFAPLLCKLIIFVLQIISARLRNSITNIFRRIRGIKNP